MYSRAQFVASCTHEIEVLKHLFSKIPADSWKYRPTPEQRSLEELLQYIPVNFGSMVELICGGKDVQYIRNEIAKSREIPVTQFCQTLDAQLERLKTSVAQVSDADLTDKSITLPNGMQMKIGEALVNFALKFHAAYRMQFFLYLKALGRKELTTPNLWMGRDPAK